MKRSVISLIILAMVLTVAVAFAGDEKPAMKTDKPWFDMDHCVFCKHLKDEPALMDNMKWETYDISNGVLTITTVKPEYQEAYGAAMKAMEETGQKMMSNPGGAPMEMCGHCQYYGMLMMSGVKMEHIPTEDIDIMIITSDKPELQAKIHEYGKRNREAMAQMDAE